MSSFRPPSVFQACNNTSDRKHADSVLEKYVTEIVMSIVTTFFSSPFSDQSTTLQVRAAPCGRVFLWASAVYIQACAVSCKRTTAKSE